MHRVMTIVAFLFAPALQAQSADSTKEPERLFRSRTPLELTIKAHFGELFKDRDTLKEAPVEGTLDFTDDRKGPLSLPIKLETRGHFRLRRTTCAFAPLKVFFDKEKAKGSAFGGQGSLKLVTHCNNGGRYEQNLLVEESTYRMYNSLTPFSHRTRLARIRYVPTQDTTKAVTRHAFFLEDDDEMAKRNRGKVLMKTGGTFSYMDTELMDLVSVFQYMIGNTDWSVFAIHNIRLVDLGLGGNYYPVAYDFDFSGLVGSPYAGPDERLPIKSVKQRLYRGPCRKLDELLPVLERFGRARDTFLLAIRETPGLETNRAKEAIDYLDGFFDRIKKPKDFDDVLGYPCRSQ
jgi:hypothetical protein